MTIPDQAAPRSAVARRGAWPTLRGTRCVVTGATGHIGVHLVRALLQAGADVYGLAEPGADATRVPAAVQRLEAPSLDPAALRDALARAAPDILFHLGWRGVRRATLNDPAQIAENVPYTLFATDAALRAGARVVIGLGSQEEYGLTSGVLDEHAEVRPAHAYGVAKHAAGTLLRELAAKYDARGVWLRLFISYGPFEDPSRLLPSVIRALLRGEAVALTAGEQRRDYLFVEDVAEALLASATTTACGVYNLGSGEAKTIRSIVEQVRELIAPDRELGFGALPLDSRDHCPLLQADTSRFRRDTGWLPRTPLPDGLRRTVAWHRSQLATSTPPTQPHHA